MTGHPETTGARQGASVTIDLTPESTAKKFKRRRCDNCGDWFPLTKANRKFCKDQCKDEFHNHGSAFGPLKVTLTKLVEKLTREALTSDKLIKAGFFHRSKFKRLPAEQSGAYLRDELSDLARHHNGLLERVRKLESPPTEESGAALRGSLDMLAGLIGGLDKRLAVVEMAQRALATHPIKNYGTRKTPANGGPSKARAERYTSRSARPLPPRRRSSR
jgi:hypothetical protein